MSKNKHVSLPRVIRVDEEVHAHLKAMAERQRRSIANLIQVIIEEAVDKDRRSMHHVGESYGEDV